MWWNSSPVLRRRAGRPSPPPSPGSARDRARGPAQISVTQSWKGRESRACVGVALAQARVEAPPQPLGLRRVAGLAFKGGGDGGAHALGPRRRRISRLPGGQRRRQSQLTLAHRKDRLLDPGRQDQGKPHRPRRLGIGPRRPAAPTRADAETPPPPLRASSPPPFPSPPIAPAWRAAARRRRALGEAGAGVGEGWDTDHEYCIKQISCQFAKAKPLLLNDDLAGVQPEREARG